MQIKKTLKDKQVQMAQHNWLDQILSWSISPIQIMEASCTISWFLNDKFQNYIGSLNNHHNIFQDMNLKYV